MAREFARVKLGIWDDDDFRDLPVQPDALLATEPGGQRVEAQRHAEFADERFNRELFEPSDRLLAHIEGLQRSPV